MSKYNPTDVEHLLDIIDQHIESLPEAVHVAARDLRNGDGDGGA